LSIDTLFLLLYINLHQHEDTHEDTGDTKATIDDMLPIHRRSRREQDSSGGGKRLSANFE